MLGDSPSHPQSGGTPALGPRSGGTPAPGAAGPPPNATRRESSGPPPRSAPQPVSGPPQQRSPQPAWQQGPPSGATVRGPSRAWMWVAAAVAAILVVGTVIFVMVNQSGDDTAGGNNTGTTQATISGGVTRSGMTTSAPVTAESGTSADTASAETASAETASAETASADTASQDVSSPDGTAGSSIPGAKVAVGDCIAIDDASQTDLNEQWADCSDPQAVYQITVIGGANADCDTNEATWIGKDGPLFGKKLCLLPNLAEGDCIRTGDKAANGDYEKIDCAEATKDDTKIVLADQNSADTSQCPAGSEPYDFPQRDKLFCFGPAS